MGAQRPARAVPEAQGDLDRKRARLDSVHHAAARFRIHDAHVGMPAAQAQAERVHRGDVLHQPAARAQQHEAHAGDLRSDQRRHPAPLCVGLAALGFRRAELDHQAAVPQGRGQAQHPRPQRRAAVQSRSAARQDGQCIGQESAGAAAGRGPGRMSMGRPAGASTDAVSAFCAEVEAALGSGKPDAVPDERLQRVLSAAVRLYAAKAEDRAQELPPFGDRPVNATEAVTAICAMMRAADLNFFDLQMWYRRAPNQ